MKKHNLRDKSGRFTSKKSTTVDATTTSQLRDSKGRFASKGPKTKKVTSKKKTKVTNTVDILILDASSSMYQYTNGTIEGVNNYIKTIADSAKHGISAMVNVMSFSGGSWARGKEAKFIWLNRNTLAVDLVKTGIQGYNANGNTPLYDAIMEGTKDLLALKSLTPDVQVTVTIFTDGEENNSNTTLTTVQQRIKELNAAGITVAYMGAGSGYSVKATATALGVDVTNTLAYEDSTTGRESAFVSLSSARSIKTESYTKGLTSNIGFFSND